MSRGGRSSANSGGIGRPWLLKYWTDVYPRGVRVLRGRDIRPPRYYDKVLQAVDPATFEYLSFSRQKLLDKKDITLPRLAVREKVTQAKISLLRRSFEEIS